LLVMPVLSSWHDHGWLHILGTAEQPAESIPTVSRCLSWTQSEKVPSLSERSTLWGALLYKRIMCTLPGKLGGMEIKCNLIDLEASWIKWDLIFHSVSVVMSLSFVWVWSWCAVLLDSWPG
jgi:hypothetical protein